MKKEIMVIKDCKFIGLANTLEIQWSKRTVDENENILDKENVRGTIDLEMAQVEGSDASERLKKFIPELNLAILKENGELNERINAMSKECAHKVKIATKESSEKLIAVTENKSLKEENEFLKKENTALNLANEDIHKKNAVLFAANERLIKEAVILDENIVNLNAQILASKKAK